MSMTYLYTEFSDVFEKQIMVETDDFSLGQLFHYLRHSLIPIEYVLLKIAIFTKT